MSDPFQPIEKQRGTTKECLKILKETQYPFVVSSKGKLLVDDEYMQLLSECNCVVQISAVCSSYNKLELGCSNYEERLKMAEILAKKVKRVIIRIQPYMHEVFNEVFNNLEKIANSGVYGVIIEGMKFRQKKKDTLVRLGNDFCYKYDLIKSDFLKLKQEAHRVGLKIYAGENRLRKYGDSLTCCGIDGLEGFIPNKFNLNHILNGDKQYPTEKMKEKGTASCFKALNMTSSYGLKIAKSSFASEMCELYKNSKNTIDEIMGICRK